VRGSQVGTVSPARAGSRSFADRLRLSLELLRDPAFDTLLSTECAFDDLPHVMPRLASGVAGTLTQTVTYDPGGTACTP
jgi:hypothetical protein